jgi:polyisoprenoid-binding protein YceI
MRRTRFVTLTVAFAAAGALALNGWSPTETRAQAPAAAAAPSLTGNWTIDGAHSHIGFAIRHMGIATIRGRFNEFSGAIVGNAEDPAKQSVQVTIKTASIDTGIPRRDDHLRTPDFMDAAQYPETTFRSTRVEKTASGLVAHGTLTMHGVSREIALPFTLSGPIRDPRAGGRIGVDTRIRLNRHDYGIKYHQVLDNGALSLANDVDIDISLEAVPARGPASR